MADRDIGLGHNNGPPLESLHGYRNYVWRAARKKAWKSPPIEVIRRRVKRARALGISYQEYTLEIMERGRYL